MRDQGVLRLQGYSQSRSIPSLPKYWFNSKTDLENSFRLPSFANTSEHGAQPPHPPRERITLRSLLIFFSPTSFFYRERVSCVVNSKSISLQMTKAENDVRQLCRWYCINSFRSTRVVSNNTQWLCCLCVKCGTKKKQGNYKKVFHRIIKIQLQSESLYEFINIHLTNEKINDSTLSVLCVIKRARSSVVATFQFWREGIRESHHLLQPDTFVMK